MHNMSMLYFAYGSNMCTGRLRERVPSDVDGSPHTLFMYAAEESHIDPALRPYSWYKRFVVEGARQHRLPPDYIAHVDAVPATEDADRNRDAANRRVSC